MGTTCSSGLIMGVIKVTVLLEGTNLRKEAPYGQSAAETETETEIEAETETET
jgi:hypothetical protein